MSDSHRGNFRGRGGGRGGSGGPSDRDARGRGRGGGGGGGGGGSNRDNRTGPRSNQKEGGEGGERERPKRDNILDLNKYVNEKMRIKFSGGREVIGILKGFDQLMNLVLDEVEEVMRDEEGNEGKRSLGLIVARGPLVTLISPFKGSEEIANPFVQADDDEEVMDGE